MTESDDEHLRATEAQMRQALGLHDDAQPRSSPVHPTPTSNGLHPQRRRFVRDGQVPVTIIHRDHHPAADTGTNQLDAARQALQAEMTARERAEGLLAEAQAGIRDLQTKLAHERLSKDEAVQQAETGKLTVLQSLETLQAELAAERQARSDAEVALAEALEWRQKAEERLRETLGARQTHSPAKAPPKRGARVEPQVPTMIMATEKVDGAPKLKRARRRGGQASVSETDSDIVEWWVPGWQEKFR